MSEQSTNHISRRRFLQLTSAGVALGGLSYLAGCGPSPTTVPTTAAGPTATTAVAAPVPTKGLKKLRYAWSEAIGSTETMDPALATSFPEYARVAMIYDLLVWVDDSFKPQPMLAESWEFNDKADEWTFHLRQDVLFHDGDKLTAKDVVYTYRRVLDPATASPGAGEMGGLSPDVIEAVDDYTVRFKLPYPVVELPLLINNGHVWIVKEGMTHDDLLTKGIGSGPYKLDSFIPGEDPTVLVKNEKYWRSGLPKVDALEMRSIAESSARLAALERGQVDVIEDPPLTDIAKLEGNPDLTVVKSRTGAWDAFIMMVDTPPCDNNNLRLALKYCLDRQQFVDLVLLGYGDVANDVPVPSWIDYGIEEPPRARDIAKAKQLLSEAGYSNGVDLELYTSGTRPTWMAAAPILKEQAAEAGINIDIKMASADTYWSEVWMKEPFCMTGWSARPCDAMLSVAFLSTAEWNETHWYRKDWDAIIEKARQTTDYEQRKALYQQAQQMLIDEGGCIVPYFMNALGATLKGVTGWLPPARKIIPDLSTIDIGG
jgi:peptide/nickel transport system substrate-binding protein